MITQGAAQAVPATGHQLPAQRSIQAIRVTDPDFVAGFQQAVIDFASKYKPLTNASEDTGMTNEAIDDTSIVMMFLMATVVSEKSDLWKAGYLAGFFAALYDITYIWRVLPTEAIFHYKITRRRKS